IMTKKTKATRRSQEPISVEELQIFINYVLSGHVSSEAHAEQIRRLSRRTTTLSDVTMLVRVLQTQADRKLTEVMDVVQIQHKVLQKLGATEEMFAEAEVEYNEMIEEARKELEAEAEAAKKAAEKKEEE